MAAVPARRSRTRPAAVVAAAACLLAGAGCAARSGSAAPASRPSSAAGRLTTGGEAVPVARGTWDSVTPFVLSLKSTEIPSGSIDAVAPKVRRAATHGTLTACADLVLEAKIF